MRARHRHFTYKAAGAVVAYDARYLTDSDGTALSTWTDRAGSYNATESDSTKQPLVRTGANAINGQTALDFDGTNDDLQATSVPLNTYITVIICGHFTNAKPMFIEHGLNAAFHNGFFFFGTNNGPWCFFRASASHNCLGVANWFGPDPAIGSLKYDGSGIYRKNGITQSNVHVSGTARSNSSVTLNLNIMSRNRISVFSDGLLGNLAIYDGAASDALLRRLEHAAAYSFKIACS